MRSLDAPCTVQNECNLLACCEWQNMSESDYTCKRYQQNKFRGKLEAPMDGEEPLTWEGSLNLKLKEQNNCDLHSMLLSVNVTQALWYLTSSNN